jgi:hypothetical protein
MLTFTGGGPAFIYYMNQDHCSEHTKNCLITNCHVGQCFSIPEMFNVNIE